MKVLNIEKVEVFYVTIEEPDIYLNNICVLKYKRVPAKTMEEDLWYLQVGDEEYHVKSPKMKQKLKEAYLDYAERTFNGCH